MRLVYGFAGSLGIAVFLFCFVLFNNPTYVILATLWFFVLGKMSIKTENRLTL